MSIEAEIRSKLKEQGADFIYFVDISDLGNNQNKGFSSAILFGIALSKPYLKEVSQNPNFVQELIRNKELEKDEFHLTEIKTDGLADVLAEQIESLGFSAYSQSENNLEKTGAYDTILQTTLLPHKTIALRAGLGWIGKHNLLVTPDFGSALSMCTVLTNAPIKTQQKNSIDSECGYCTVCSDACIPNALPQTHWEKGISRDEMLLVNKCTTCLQCMVQCPFTQKYISENKNLN